MFVSSEEELLDLVLHLLDLGVQAGVGVTEDSASNDVTAHTASAAEVSLLRHVNVGNVLLKWRV